MAETKKFTREELKSRNNKRDALFVIHNSVYEVTSFLDSHPGGEEVLLEKAGKDASEGFEDVGHSSDARELMKKYKVGEVVEEDRVEQTTRPRTWSPEDEAQSTSSSGTNSWLIPLVLGVLATVIYRMFFA